MLIDLLIDLFLGFRDDCVNVRVFWGVWCVGRVYDDWLDIYFFGECCVFVVRGIFGVVSCKNGW